MESKAAALVQSVALNHALVDGNKRLALGSLIAFLGVNGRRLTMSNDAAYDFIIDIVTHRLEDVPAIAAVTDANTTDRRVRGQNQRQPASSTPPGMSRSGS